MQCTDFKVESSQEIYEDSPSLHNDRHYDDILPSNIDSVMSNRSDEYAPSLNKESTLKSNSDEPDNSKFLNELFIMKFSNNEKPNVKQQIKYLLDSDQIIQAQIISRAGETCGKNKNCF